MENEPPTPGLEDGITDVERLLGEPQDGHESVDCVISCNEKIQANVMGMEDVSRSFGFTEGASCQERKDILNEEVLDVMPSPTQVEAGYFRLHSNFCSMGDDYLLGSGGDFDENISNMEYGSSEGLRTSISGSQMQVYSVRSDTTWKSDPFRITEGPNSSSEQFNAQSSKLGYLPRFHDHQMLVEGALSVSHRFTFQNVSNFHKNSRCSLQDTVSDDENGSILSPSSLQVFSGLNNPRNNECELADQEEQTNKVNGHGEEAILPVKPSSGGDTFPTHKRSRKPTRRYVDELPDPASTFSKKRRSSSTGKDKTCRVKDKKSPIRSKEVGFLDEEEFSVKAIQVPFGSLVYKECPKEHSPEMVQQAESRKLMTMSKCKRVTPENQNELVTAVHPKVKDDCSASQKRSDACVNVAYKKNRNGRITAVGQKKQLDCIVDDCLKNKNDNAATVSPKKRDNHCTAKQQKKKVSSDDESLDDEVSVRRKHHRLWTITEVKKLIDGVSQYGVGRWSRIKKLFFSSSVHRTSVDLKDKWRNLLKASGVLEQGNQQGEKKRSVAWRPLPKSILRRVRDLATLYPYPKGQRPKISGPNKNKDNVMIHDDSPDRSADITLSDYRRILRSIGGN